MITYAHPNIPPSDEAEIARLRKKIARDARFKQFVWLSILGLCLAFWFVVIVLVGSWLRGLWS